MIILCVAGLLGIELLGIHETIACEHGCGTDGKEHTRLLFSLWLVKGQSLICVQLQLYGVMFLPGSVAVIPDNSN
jgi:hypothetical protein